MPGPNFPLDHHDDRLTPELVDALADVLTRYGFPVASGQDRVELGQALERFVYGEGKT